MMFLLWMLPGKESRTTGEQCFCMGSGVGEVSASWCGGSHLRSSIHRIGFHFSLRIWCVGVVMKCRGRGVDLSIPERYDFGIFSIFSDICNRSPLSHGRDRDPWESRPRSVPPTHTHKVRCQGRISRSTSHSTCRSAIHALSPCIDVSLTALE